MDLMPTLNAPVERAGVARATHGVEASFAPWAFPFEGGVEASFSPWAFPFE